MVDSRRFNSDRDSGAIESFSDVELEGLASRAKAFLERASGTLWPVSTLLLNLLQCQQC